MRKKKIEKAGHPFHPRAKILISFIRGSFSITVEENRERRHSRACVFRSSAWQL